MYIKRRILCFYSWLIIWIISPFADVNNESYRNILLSVISNTAQCVLPLICIICSDCVWPSWGRVIVAFLGKGHCGLLGEGSLWPSWGRVIVAFLGKGHFVQN